MRAIRVIAVCVLGIWFLGADVAAAQSMRPSETLREAWIGKLRVNLLDLVMQFRVVDVASGGTQVYFDSVTEGRLGFEGTWIREDDRLTFEIPAIKLVFSGTVNARGDVAEGLWRQGGRELPLTLRKQATEYRNLKVWEHRPQRPQPPFPYDAEEVRFTNVADDITLAGTLTVPPGPGPHPAVVLITGSGPQDRDQFFMEHRSFLVLADYLTRRGIAVLRYDDRGTAQSTGTYSGATIEDFAKDASAAVEFLTRRPRIDAGRIGLAGHSEGGVVAPMVANMRSDVAFVVLMATTGVDGKTVLAAQSDALLRASGATDLDMEVGGAVNRAVMQAAADARPGEDSTAAIMAAAERVVETLPDAFRETAGQTIRAQVRGQLSRLQDPWMRHFLAYDPAPALRALRVPVLAITGTRDLQVIPTLNVPAIREAFAQNPTASIVELEGLNHLFQAAETGQMAEYVEIEETINPGALAAIGDWIVTLFPPRSSPRLGVLSH